MDIWKDFFRRYTQPLLSCLVWSANVGTNWFPWFSQREKDVICSNAFYMFAFRYSHRSLNVKKLLAVKFSYLGRNMTVQRMQKLHRLPEVRIELIKLKKRFFAYLSPFLSCSFSQFFGFFFLQIDDTSGRLSRDARFWYTTSLEITHSSMSLFCSVVFLSCFIPQLVSDKIRSGAGIFPGWIWIFM